MWSPPPSLAGGYTFAHIWHALRNDRRFDYAFYAEVALILVSRVMIRLCSRLLVPLATVLILALGYAGLFVVSAGFLSRWPLVFYVNCCIGPIVLWKILRNYFLTVLTSPGYSSDALGKTEASNLEEQAHQNQCKKCQLPKPSRAHHCSVCNQCTLQMDHHCPFVNNCVGERNYRFFVRFLAWTSAGTAYLTALTLTLLLLTHSAHDYYAALTARTDLLLVPSSSALSAVSLAPVAYLNARLAQRFPSEVLLLVFVLALAGSVCVSVSILAAFHAYLLLSGQTTIDYLLAMTRRSGRASSEGMRENYRKVCGEEMPWAAHALLRRCCCSGGSLQDAFRMHGLGRPRDQAKDDAV